MKRQTKWVVIALPCVLALGSTNATFAQDSSPGAMDTVIAVGPLDSLSANRQEFSVLGRVFQTDNAIGLTSGDYVAVHANLKRDGSVSNVWVEALGTYVPGSDFVYEQGVVTEVMPFLGQFSISGSKVDYTASMYATDTSVPELGDVIAVSGIQPSSQSPLLADGLMASADRARDAALHIGGPRRSSIQGSGLQSASIQGSGVQSASIQGSGVQSASIQGSGIRSSSIQGSGVQSASIQGSGIRSSSIQGSGVQSASIQGSGIRSSSIQGSGVQSASIQGSGYGAR